MDLIQTCEADRPVAVQIYGSDGGEMRAAAQWLEEFGVFAVDINMGCPVHKVCRGGGGSALMCDPAATVQLVRGVVEAVRIPVTVKMRLGLDDTSWSAPHFAREFEQAGVAAVTIHGRTRAQGFTGNVNLAGIAAVVEAVERIPIIGNGDVLSVADAEEMLRVTGCAGIAIGRGTLLNPWIFAQLDSWSRSGDPGPGPTRSQRLAFMARHFRLLAHYRTERLGCLLFRKVANWYCRVLHPGREIQQQLVRLESGVQFEEILARLEQQTGLEDRYTGPEPVVPVPTGPVAHW